MPDETSSNQRNRKKTPSKAPTEETRRSVSPPVAADAPRPLSSVGAADEVEDFSDFSDDVDEILNRDDQPPSPSDAGEQQAEAELPSESVRADSRTPSADTAEQAKDIGSDSNALVSHNVVAEPGENRSTDGEDLLGGMEIEQISDEELEDESNKTGNDNFITISLVLI